jgi:hypothetical protein
VGATHGYFCCCWLQELELIDGLPLGPDDRWLALLYRAKAKKV